MKFCTEPMYSYISDADWYMTPTGEVGFFRDDIPEEIKERLLEDIKKKQEEEEQREDILDPELCAERRSP